MEAGRKRPELVARYAPSPLGDPDSHPQNWLHPTDHIRRMGVIGSVKRELFQKIEGAHDYFSSGGFSALSAIFRSKHTMFGLPISANAPEHFHLSGREEDFFEI